MLCLYVMSDTALSLGGSREYKQSVAAKQVCMFMQWLIQGGVEGVATPPSLHMSRDT